MKAWRALPGATIRSSKIMPTPEENQTHDGAGLASAVLFSVDGRCASFRLTVTHRSSHTISGTVEEITSWAGDGSWAPGESELYLKFYMKWDGCCHVWFGEEDEEGKQDGYLHLCGADSWDKHIALMRWLYKWAEAEIPMQTDVSGNLSENTEGQATAKPLPAPDGSQVTELP